MGLALASSDHWVPAPHLVLLNGYLRDIMEGRLKRLVVSIPVRHGKSEMISGWFPADFLGVYPDKKVLMIGHSGDYAEEWGGFARDVLETDGPDLFELTVSRTSSSKRRWRIALHPRGGMFALGTGGSLPGKGANVLLIDDPVKSPEQAFSKRMRDKLWNWYTNIARSRLTPDGATILVMSRWHQDDFAGRLMKQWDELGLPYIHLHLAALAMKNDPLGRKEGEALAPELGWDKPTLEQIKREVPYRIWTGQYQGVPTEEEGDFFKKSMFCYYDFAKNGHFFILDDGRTVPLAKCSKRQSVDLATTPASEGGDPDFTVVITYAMYRPWGLIFILNVTRVQIGKPDLMPLLHKEWQTWGVSKQRIEKYGYQKSAVQDAIARGLPAEEVDKGRQSKEDVAEFTATRMRSRSIWFPKRAWWLDDFEAELLAYPAGHDDQVDGLGYAALDLLAEDNDHDIYGSYMPSR